MAETVKVSLLQGHSFRAKKSDPYVHYKPGIVEMPLEHARAMGLLHRVVRQSSPEAPVVRDSFIGTFDERLTRILNDAGYRTLDDLRSLSHDELIAIEGVGPAAYERIKRALQEE